MGRRDKEPAFKEHLVDVKAPATQEEVDTDNKNISWRVAMIDKDGNFGWGSVTSQLLWGEVWPRMEFFEKTTFAKLNKKKHHSVKCSKLTKPARDRLKVIKLDDTEKLFSLYFRAKLRLYGIRHGNVFYILWLDINHGVFHSSKGNT